MATLAGETRQTRLGWQDLPVDLRSKLAFSLGAGVVRVLRQDAGVADALSARLQLDNGRWVFLRALPPGHPLAEEHRVEAKNTALLPERAPVPRLLCMVEHEWLALVYSDLDGARPNLRPGSPDCSATLTALGRLARTLTPCPIPSARDFLAERGAELARWTELFARPRADLDVWVLEHADALITVETAWHPWAEGDTLLHNDLRVDNMVRTGPGQVLITGWRRPGKGAAWLDMATMVPLLLTAGHTTPTAEKLVLRRPELRGIPAWAITGYAAALCGHWLFESRLAEPEGEPGLRARQRLFAAAALRWVRYRTRW